MPTGFTNYSKFDKLEDYEPDSDEEDWKLSESEKKSKQEKKRDALIQHELDGYKLIDEKLAIAERLPPRLASAGEYTPIKEATNWSEGRKPKKEGEGESKRYRAGPNKMHRGCAWATL